MFVYLMQQVSLTLWGALAGAAVCLVARSVEGSRGRR